MLKHQVRINVISGGVNNPVVTGGEVTLRNRILNALFGQQQKIFVLMPADSVASVEIKEIREASDDEKTTASNAG